MSYPPPILFDIYSNLGIIQIGKAKAIIYPKIICCFKIKYPVGFT